MAEPARYGLMIDLETLSLNSTAFVLQIGWVLYDFHRYDVVQAACYGVHADGQENAHVRPETVTWWHEQTQAARDSVFGNRFTTVHHSELLRTLKALDLEFQPLVWAGPAMFDLPILVNLLGERPWNYGRERDFSTVRKLYDPIGFHRPMFAGEPHVAGDDALHQMQYLATLHKQYNVHR